MNKEDWIKNVIIVSGGFDPVHKGHIRMFREAANLGANVVVGLNSDEWLKRKKGKPFMEWEERAEILESCKFINQVISFDDSDDTANDAIKRVFDMYNADSSNYNIYFANGGDRKLGNVPELDTCKELEVIMLWGIGGGKIQSSSWLINGEKNE
jgi:D-beta-D-heptose 7-phosphate kinase/D-beta-D-heptose 1-phosphate adenosyltransferase